jgi:hypothetical protein
MSELKLRPPKDKEPTDAGATKGAGGHGGGAGSLREERSKRDSSTAQVDAFAGANAKEKVDLLRSK